jgi:nitrate/nitrite-specific signal transduction histidine kinase
MCNYRISFRGIAFKTGDSHYQVEASLPLEVGPSSIPGGEEKPAHSHFLVSTTLLNLSDEPMVLVSINDITARKQAEQGLHDSVQKLRIAYQQAQIYAQELAQEISERKRAEKELKRRNEELNALNTIATTIGQSLELKQILPVVLEQALTLLGLDGGWIQLLDPQRGELALVTQCSVSPKMAQKMAATKANQGLSSQVVQTGEPVIIADVATDSQFAAELPPGESLHTLLSAPVKAQDKVWGVLTAFSHNSRRLTTPDAQLLAAIGQQLGMAVEKLHLAEITGFDKNLLHHPVTRGCNV